MPGICKQIKENKRQMHLIRFCFSWIKSEQGSTAVEFSMLAMPFVYLVLGTIEISLMFASNSVLDGATNDAARLIRTGAVQQASGDPVKLFKDKLCEKASVMLDCNKIKFEVIEMDKFADFNSYAPKFDKNGDLISSGFNPGGVDSVNLIRVTYNYPLITPLIGNLLSNGPNMTRQMISTIILETEPYDITQVAGSL